MPAVVRFDPFRDITTLRDEMNRLVTRTMGEGASAGSSWTPAVDIFDAADAIELKAELPGLSPEDIDMPQGVKADEITAGFDNGVLTVRVPKADEVKPRKIAVGPGVVEASTA